MKETLGRSSLETWEHESLAPRGVGPASPYKADADVTIEIAKHSAGCWYIPVNIVLGIYYPINYGEKVTT